MPAPNPLSRLPAGRHLLTVEESLAKLCVSRPTLYDYINSGQIRSVKFGKMRRIPSDEIERLIDGKGLRPGKAVPDRHPNPVANATKPKAAPKKSARRWRRSRRWPEPIDLGGTLGRAATPNDEGDCSTEERTGRTMMRFTKGPKSAAPKKMPASPAKGAPPRPSPTKTPTKAAPGLTVPKPARR
jgi:excisionase family DNA binding protein